MNPVVRRFDPYEILGKPEEMYVSVQLRDIDAGMWSSSTT